MALKKLILAGTIALSSTNSNADTVAFSLCNEYGAGPKKVVVKDKKSSNAVLFDGSLKRDQCVDINAFSSDGKFAEVQIEVAGETPYGVPWIAPNDKVSI